MKKSDDVYRRQIVTRALRRYEALPLFRDTPVSFWDGLLFQCPDKAWKTQVRLRNRAIAPTSAERKDPTRLR